ncbi:hypothetical protein INR49_008228 [Caranx melampygus]|nr:hypothetical protein INR49_008228 [Caranx melampygus]
MAQINACLKRVFTVFNILFAFHHGLLLCYTVGTITMVIAILGAYGAYKERLVPLIIHNGAEVKAFLPLDQASPEDQNEVNFLQSQSLLSKSIYTKPCFPIILHFMQLVLDIALAIVFSLLVLALLGMILSSIIIHQMRYPTILEEQQRYRLPSPQCRLFSSERRPNTRSCTTHRTAEAAAASTSCLFTVEMR